MKISQLFSDSKKDGIDESVKGEAAAYVLYALAKHQREEENNSTEALALYNRALVMQRQAMGKDHIIVARTLHDIGLCLTSLGQSFPALTALEEALWIRQKELGPGDPAVAETTTALWKLLSNERHRIEDEGAMTKGGNGDDTTASEKATTTTTLSEMKMYTPAASMRRSAGSPSRSTTTKPKSANARSA